MDRPDSYLHSTYDLISGTPILGASGECHAMKVEFGVMLQGLALELEYLGIGERDLGGSG